MIRLFKTLLPWLLIAMLPLHAVSASMPMSCTPAHHKVWQTGIHNEAHQVHGMQHQHDTSLSAHGDHHDASQMHHAASDNSVADGSASSTQPHAGCSACAAGCIGAAAPPLAWQATPSFGGSEAVLLSPVPLAVGYPSADLERPPKTILS